MNEALDAVSWVLLVIGGVVSVVSALGAVRLEGLFQRMHGATMMDTFGAACVLAGLALQAETFFIAFKLLFVFVLLALTTSTAAHALAKSALASGVYPLGVDREQLGRDLSDVIEGRRDRERPAEEDSTSAT
ncbi:MAG: monovalent cation/H(+) antiporter subunit G [Planctomycetota bacterium]